jgi:hypothetical protein
MQCQCGKRRAKRACPALGHEICAVCCGTKRLVEIRCPPDCGYLTSARVHPPATLQRQHESDIRFLAPLVHQLSESQHHIFVLLQVVVRKHAAMTLPSINDQDVADAAGALAATLESAGRGIIYEHRPASLPAQRVLADLERFVRELVKEAPRAEREAAVALRALERVARSARSALEADDRAFLRLTERMLRPTAGRDPADSSPPDAPSTEPSRLILP